MRDVMRTRFVEGDRVVSRRTGVAGVVSKVLPEGRHVYVVMDDGSKRWALSENLDIISRRRVSYMRDLAKSLLREAEDEDEKKDKKPSKKETQDSIDSQVDEYLGGYESQAKGDEDEEFDVGSYASDVVRLIENYDSLLEIRDTVVRRALNRLRETHGDDVADQFTQTMKDTHDVEVGKSKIEKKTSIEAPTAAEAGPSGGGGGGV